MSELRSRLVGLGFVAAAAVVLACSGGADATGPLAENHPAIPLFKTQGTCVQWSCAIGDCVQNPAIYGACCTSVDEDQGVTPAPRPSCDGPPPPSTFPPYCQNDNSYQTCIDYNIYYTATKPPLNCADSSTHVGADWSTSMAYPSCNPGLDGEQ